MSLELFNFLFPFINKATKYKIQIKLLNKSEAKEFITAQHETVRIQIEQNGFEGKAGTQIVLRDEDALAQTILVGYDDDLNIYTLSSLFALIQNAFSADFISSASFEIDEENLDSEQLNKLCTSWGVAGYKYDSYKKDENAKPAPSLIWPKGADQDYVTAQISSMCLIRNLINTPPNILGTDELAQAATDVAKKFKAKVKIIKDEELQKQNFPLIYTVGKASPRRPQLVDMTWGNKTDPKFTIVGKGIIYDTGGLNLKPGMYMRDMKKDMGGAAHALGLAWMIMALKLPVQLRVLIPIAENAVAGNSYRPGDILTSRKGLSIEIGDTDAEGRLVVADALTYASEDNPEFMVDFCTLTGAARVALGYDIPAFFSNNEKTIDDLRKTSVMEHDPVWPLPLWKGYMKDIQTPIADLTNDGKGRAGAIYGGLFLESFVGKDIDWIHVDCYAWEQSGRPGRPQGGADTGMRAIFKMVQTRYT